MARYSFSGWIPAKFEHKLRRHKQSFGKIATTVVLDKDENLSWSGLQRHRSCHSNEMTVLPVLLAAVYLGAGNCSSKIVTEQGRDHCWINNVEVAWRPQSPQFLRHMRGYSQVYSSKRRDRDPPSFAVF